MSTRPVICPGEGQEGFLFNRGNLVIDDGTHTNLPSYLLMNDLELEISSYSRSRINVGPGKSFLLSQTDIADNYGYVSFIAVRVDYKPETVESKKYIEWEYDGNVNYLGELMVLSGKRTSSINSAEEGWDLSNPSEFFSGGGIIFSNPHPDFSVRMEILIGR